MHERLPINNFKNKHFIIVLAFIGFSAITCSLSAQLPYDAIYMPKKTVCAVAAYSYSEWTEYWENTLLRDNANIGKHIDQSAMLMAAAGLTDRLNLLISLPYITTKNTQGNLLGQQGIQDLTLQLKYKFYNQKGLSVHGVLGGSMPMSKYVPDFLPMSIGLHSTNVRGRGIVSYLHQTGLYVTAHGAYIGRSKITVDRDSYQAYDRVYNSNRVAIPNVTEGGLRLGYLKPTFQVEAFLESSAGVGGDNILRNNAPFPTNNMTSKSFGGYLKVQPKNIGFSARIAHVASGRNVGHSIMFMAGLLYQINPKSRTESTESIDKPHFKIIENQ